MRYCTIKDAIHAAELFIEEGYTTPVQKEAATKKLRQILDNEALPDAEKIEKIMCIMFSKGQPWTIPVLNMQFVYVEPGTFRMGRNDVFEKENPLHSVTISNGYWIGKYPVTQGEYQSIIGNNPSNFNGANKPVDQVNWDDAVAFCQKLTERERAAGRLPAGHEYRLPTEAEWEFAARGGNASKGYLYSGSNDIDSVAWYDCVNSDGTTHEVGTKKANELGIYDMSGNVEEWCSDLADGDSGDIVVDSDGETVGPTHLVRGGCWSFLEDDCSVACRNHWPYDLRCCYVGLRVVLGPVST